jgi:GNAT superfamily N-acetyltransferase
VAVGPEQIAAIVRTTVDLYRIAESALAQIVTRHLAADIDSDSWAVNRLAALGQLRAAAQNIVAQLDDKAADEIRHAVAAGYRQGSASVLTDLPKDEATRLAARAGAAVFRRPDVVESLATALISDVGVRHSNVVRHVVDVYRSVVAAGAAASVAGGLTRREAAQLAYARFVDQGVASFVDQRGRTWRLSSYVEMGLRTVTQRAAVQGQTDRQAQLGLSFVMVSNEAQECPRCRPYEGQVLRVDNGPTGTVKATNPATGEIVAIDVKATLAGARAAGFQHPNCRHSVRAYLPGVTQLPKGPTADPSGDVARRRQRDIERQIRRWKEREAAALTPEGKGAARAKVKGWQGAMREHLAANPKLKRLPYREQIGAGNMPRGVRPTTPPRPPTPPTATAPPLPRRTPAAPPPKRPDDLQGLLDLDLSTQANRDMARDVLADIIGGDYAGLTVEIKGVSEIGAGTSRAGVLVSGKIYPGDDLNADAIGDFARGFYRQGDGPLVAVHALLTLKRDYRGKGFAGAFNSALEQWYRQEGVERIEVHANIDVGGYTWATQGFQFDDEESADDVIERLRFMVDIFTERVDELRQEAEEATAETARTLREHARKLEAQLDEAADILERADTSRFGDPEFPTSTEISQTGRSHDTGNPKEPWIGKAAMLGSDWHGVKWL